MEIRKKPVVRYAKNKQWVVIADRLHCTAIDHPNFPPNYEVTTSTIEQTSYAGPVDDLLQDPILSSDSFHGKEHFPSFITKNTIYEPA